MCEPFLLRKTGLTVEEHQQRILENYLELRGKAPELPWVPVLQGWSLGAQEYTRIQGEVRTWLPLIEAGHYPKHPGEHCNLCPVRGECLGL